MFVLVEIVAIWDFFYNIDKSIIPILICMGVAAIIYIVFVTLIITWKSYHEKFEVRSSSFTMDFSSLRPLNSQLSEEDDSVFYESNNTRGESMLKSSFRDGEVVLSFNTG